MLKPRKLRFTTDGPPPEPGQYLQLPTSTSYEILEAAPSRSVGWYRLTVLRTDPATIPPEATILPMVWLRAGRRVAK